MKSNFKSRILYAVKLSAASFLVGVIIVGMTPAVVSAKIETTFLYTLSNFNGPVALNKARINVDKERNEIYVADPRKGAIVIFNAKGMEIYRFGEEGNLGNFIDVAVKPDGNILILSRTAGKPTILVCNFKGEPLATLVLKNIPPDFSNIVPTHIVYRHQQIYLLDKTDLRLVVTDPDGLFKNGYDIGSLIKLDAKKRHATEIAGFSVDREGNMLFTVPVLFSVFKLTPDRKISGFGRPGSAPGRFNVVGGIVADDKGYLYVADRLKSAVLIFDKDFKFQTEFGYRGIRPHNLIGPNNLGLDNQNQLYVSQLSSRGISVFKISYK
jgi:DNA-binding beta-propeller fold protein YncE